MNASAFKFTHIVSPGEFEPVNHWYPKAHNAQIHPLVGFFLGLSQEQIINRYCHLHPTVQPEDLAELLSYRARHFYLSGSDLFYVTSEGGKRQVVVIETNSSPSGQKSMPLFNELEEQGGYRTYLRDTFRPGLKNRRLPKGGLALLYDKNFMEASGYAAAMADEFEEKVFLTPFMDGDPDPPARFVEGVLEVRDQEGNWHPIRAAHRYVTQKPWNRIPVQTKTAIFNPIISCLAGGRNKMVAAKAYDHFNAELSLSGLKINVPETIWDVHKNEIPLWFKRLGGHAVIKNPYSNAGQGVWTIVNEQEFEDFMNLEYPYELYIVQSLIGNYQWSSVGSKGKLYQVGTMPNKKGQSFVADLRMMVQSTAEGIRPLSIYARRAKQPLVDNLEGAGASWDILGTNLSNKLPDGSFESDATRLVLMDRKDFNKLGIGIDELIEAFIQSAMCLIAIDKMARNLINQKGAFRLRLFRDLNRDEALIREIKLK